MAIKTKNMKLVINAGYGGFSISRECAEFMVKLGDKQAEAELNDWNKRQSVLNYYKKNKKFPDDCDEDLKSSLEIDAKYECEAKFYGYGYEEGFDNGYERTNENLIKAVEELGKKANGDCATLKVVEIPDDVDYYIDEYDGFESVNEKHRSWG